MQIISADIPGVYTTQELTPYETEVTGSTTYIRYTDGMHIKQLRGVVKEVEKQLIYRKTVVGNITRWEKAFDLWTNRTTATYIPINSQLNPLKSYQ